MIDPVVIVQFLSNASARGLSTVRGSCYEGTAGGGAPVPVAPAAWRAAGGGRNSGKYDTSTDRSAIATENMAGVDAFAFWAGVSESQLCRAKMTAVHPIILSACSVSAGSSTQYTELSHTCFA